MRVPLFVLLCLFSFSFARAPAHADEPCRLSVYTYDSLAGKGGFGARVFEDFARQTGCKINVLASGDAIQTLARVEIDGKRGAREGDLVFGVDALLWERLIPYVETAPFTGILFREPARSAARENPGFIPYDYGVLGLMEDGPADASVPLSDLSQEKWRRDFILEDPRTSTPGLQFVLFTKQVLGNGFADYWKGLHWLAMPSGWDAAYGLFLAGKARRVWSYLSSEAYHRSKGESRYRATLFREGQPVQVEGVAILKSSAHPAAARRFVRFLLSEAEQRLIPETQWMWPVLPETEVPLPESFRALPKPGKLFVLSGKKSAEVLKEWSQAVHQ